MKVSQDDERYTLVELLVQLGARFEDAELHATGSVTLNLEDGRQISIPVDAVGWANAVLRFVLDQQVANEGRQVPEGVTIPPFRPWEPWATEPPQAWDNEYGDVVVWGTHDPVEAEAAFARYCEEVGAEYDEDSRPEFQHFSTHWAHPACLGIEDEPWPRSFVSDEPVEGWAPVMFVRGR